MELSYHHLPAFSSSKMGEILSALGFEEIVRAHQKKHFRPLRDLSQWRDRLRSSWKSLLSVIADLAPPAKLSPGQERRMDELANFIETLDISGSGPEFEIAAIKGGDEFAVVLGAFADLGGFDRGVLSAEADELARWEGGQLGIGTPLYIFDGATEVQLNWNHVPTPEALRDTLIELLRNGAWIAERAAEALARYPDPEPVIKKVNEFLHTLHPVTRNLAAWLVGVIDAEYENRYETWLAGDDPVLRRMAGRLIARRYKSGQRIGDDLVLQLLDEPDDAARASILNSFSGVELPRHLQRRVLEAKKRTDTGWQCPSCDQKNAPRAEQCTNCRNQAPHIPKHFKIESRPRRAIRP